MLVREWMVKNVITVTPESSMLKASKLLKDHGFKRMPVIDVNRKVVGIISDRDIKDASPSKATTLDIHELHYLLSEIKVKDIMVPEPITISPIETVEKAALLMDEKGFGSLPVVDEEGVLAGFITDKDIFKIYVNLTGSHYGGMQLALLLDDAPGTAVPLMDLLQKNNANVITILTANCRNEADKRKVYVHLHPMDRSEENKLVELIKKEFQLLYWVREKVYEV